MIKRKASAIMLSAALILSTAGCGKKDNDLQNIESEATNVTVYAVNTGYLQNSVSYTGELKTADNTVTTSKVSARVAKVNVKEGDYVKAGDVLAELDASDLQNAYNSSLASYNSALAGYNSVINSATKQASTTAKNALSSAQLAYDQALKTYNRENELYNSKSSIKLAEQSYNDALTAYNREKELYEDASTLKLAEQSYNDAVAAYNREKELYDNDTSLISAKNSLQTAEDNLANAESLYAIGAMSKMELDSARSSVENMRASLATLNSQKQAAYDNAYSAMVRAQENLQNTRINASAAYDNAYSNLVKAEENLRSARLNESTAYDAAKNALDNAANSLTTAKENIGLTDISNKSSVETSSASLESARNALKTATDNLNNTKVRALSSGYVASKKAEVGQMAAAGSELFVIKNTNALIAEIEVTESVIPYLSQGTKALVDIQSAGIEKADGFVTLVNPTKNEQTGMYTVQVGIANVDNKLNTGMFADVTLAVEESPNAVMIPNNSIIQSGEEYYVYVASPDGTTAEKKLISVGIESDEYTEVISGITVGDRVIVTGQDYLSDDNNKINIVTE